MAKRLPVCPTYALLHSGQVSLYTPDSENLSGLGFLWESRFPIVFVLRNAILSCLSEEVGKVGSFLAYVGEAGPRLLGCLGCCWSCWVLCGEFMGCDRKGFII